MTDQDPLEFFLECEVGLLYTIFGLQHQINILAIHGDVLGFPPLGGLS